MRAGIGWAAAAMAVTACGSEPAPHVRWWKSLQAPRAAVTDPFAQEDGAGRRWVGATFQTSPPEVHLQKRTADGGLLFEKVLVEGLAAPGVHVDLARTASSFGHYAAATPGGALFVLASGDDGKPRLVRFKPEGALECVGDLPVAGPCVTVHADANGQASVQCLRGALNGAPGVVVRVSAGCAVEWTRDFGAPAVYDALGNVYVASQDGAAQGGGTIAKFDPNGLPLWSKVVEHLDPGALGVANDGTLFGVGEAHEHVRFAGEAWNFAAEPDPAFGGRVRWLFGVDASGTLRWTASMPFKAPLAFDAATGDVLDRGEWQGDESTLALRDRAGHTKWSFTLKHGMEVRSAAFGPDGDALVTLTSNAPFDVGDTHVEPDDAVSPVVLDLTP